MLRKELSHVHRALYLTRFQNLDSSGSRVDQSTCTWLCRTECLDFRGKVKTDFHSVLTLACIFSYVMGSHIPKNPTSGTCSSDCHGLLGTRADGCM